MAARSGVLLVVDFASEILDSWAEFPEWENFFNGGGDTGALKVERTGTGGVDSLRDSESRPTSDKLALRFMVVAGVQSAQDRNPINFHSTQVTTGKS